MASLNFDASTVEPAAPMIALPKGRYNVEISDSELKDTQAGTGKYLALEFTVLDGEFVGRKLWSNLNLINPNPKAEEIARRELSAVCHAVGVIRVADSSELHGRPLAVEVVIEKDNNGADRNRIKGFIAADASTQKAFPAFASAKPAAAVAAPAAPAKAAAPWAKKAVA